MRTCTKCGIAKPESEYHKSSGRTDGLKASCKECCGVVALEYYSNNKLYYYNYGKEWQANNQDRVKEQRAKHYNKKKDDPAFKESNRAKSREWYKNNGAIAAKTSRAWKKNNPDRIRAHMSKQMEKPDYKLNHSMRGNMSRSIRGEKGRRSWESLAGYTVYDLREHLESLFTEGMSWDNYGSWEIDHRTPVSVFNFTTAECIDFKRCWALENLQPLWAKENRAKWAKLEAPFQPSLGLRA